MNVHSHTPNEDQHFMLLGFQHSLHANNSIQNEQL